MSFPENWSHDAARRLAGLALGTVHLAVEQAGTWTTPWPQLRAAVRYSPGYEVATAGRMATADTFGRHILLTAPHFEIRVEPGGHQRPAGATFYRTGAEQAARIVRDEWGSAIASELSPREAHAMTEDLLGPLGDG